MTTDQTEWGFRDEPRWLLRLAAPLGPPLALWLTSAALQPEAAPMVALPAALLAVAWVRLVTRRRVRLTEAGVEVRTFFITVYPWAQIESVQLSPEYEGRSISLHLRDAAPSPSREELPLPRGATTTSAAALVTMQRRLVRRQGRERREH